MRPTTGLRRAVPACRPNTEWRPRMSLSRPVDQAASAAEFIGDRPHEQYFDTLMWGLRKARDRAASEVPEWEQLRDLASAIKEHTLSHLAEYLEQFEASAERNGVEVHWAHDAYEATRSSPKSWAATCERNISSSRSPCSQRNVTCANILRIVASLSPRRTSANVSSSSTTSHPLISSGQRREKSAGCRKCLRQILRIRRAITLMPFTCARNALSIRAPQLRGADAGMTGGNFAIAETGAMVTVTNEGNADLSGNVPKLRICSVGIEKVILTNQDLAVFIRLLSRAPWECLSRSTRRISAPRVRVARCTLSLWTTAARSALAWRSSGHRSNVFVAELA